MGKSDQDIVDATMKATVSVTTLRDKLFWGARARSVGAVASEAEIQGLNCQCNVAVNGAECLP